MDSSEHVMIPIVSPIRWSDKEQSERERKIASAVQTILESIGEDPGREGLTDTPTRFARAILFLTQGYHSTAEVVYNDAIFNVECNDLVTIKDIDISSLCEHHLLPFTGKIHIAYVPRGQVLGLSKVVRIVEMFSRRLQVQERLTQQVAIALQQIVDTDGVAAVAECEHMCMAMRGVQKKGTITVTQSKTGIFQTHTHLFEQFYSLLHVAQR